MRDLCPKCSAQISARTGLCPLCPPPAPDLPPENPMKVGRVASFMTVAVPLMVVCIFAAFFALRAGWKPEALKGLALVKTVMQAGETLGVIEPPPPPPPPSPEWRIRGRAYDLFTLAAVDSVDIIFTHKETGNTFSATTDKDGRFEAVLPPVKFEGYHLSIARRGYRDIFFEEMSPAYHTQSRSRRIDALDLIRGSYLVHVPLFSENPSATVEYDLILIPLD